MSLTASQLEALRDLQQTLDSVPMVIIGATALGFYGGRSWRHTADVFTWLDEGRRAHRCHPEHHRPCIAHEVNPRAYLHVVTKLIVQGWSQSKLRDLLPDRMLASHPELYVGDRSTLPEPPGLAASGP